MLQYLMIFLISMVPIIELRGAMVYAVGYGLPYIPALIVCVVGNMLPVPFVYFFARKFLTWGVKQKHIGKLCNFFLFYQFDACGAQCGRSCLGVLYVEDHVSVLGVVAAQERIHVFYIDISGIENFQHLV